MLGYTAADVIDQITPADISDPQGADRPCRDPQRRVRDADRTGFRGPGVQGLARHRRRLRADLYPQGRQPPAGGSVGDLAARPRWRDHRLPADRHRQHERKRVEAERALLDQVLQDKNAELESARCVAERANLAKSEFLSSMSHELRTPLSAILGFAQLIESGTPQPTILQKRSIDQILKAGWYLLELINEILDLALIESGKLSLSVEPVSLSEVMYECEAMVEAQALRRGIGVAFSSLEMPCFVNADRTRVKQVLINLLSNAIKYNRVGGTVTVECTRTSRIRFASASATPVRD
jgi:signal transduction histidine kinase